MTSKTSQSKSRDDNDGVMEKKESTKTAAPTSSDGKMSTTRVCIKGIPPMYDELNLKRHLLQSSKKFDGDLVITDCKVLKTNQGISRKVAFVGFKTSEMAQFVISYFHRTYAQTSRLVVEAAVEKGVIESKKKKKADRANEKLVSSSRRVDDDTSTRAIDRKKEEFLSVMMGTSNHTGKTGDVSGGSNSKFWANDDGGMLTHNSRPSISGDDETKKTGDNPEEGEKTLEHGADLVKTNVGSEDGEKKDAGETNPTGMSDMDFLRSKIVDTKDDKKNGDGVNDNDSTSTSGDSSRSDSSSVTSSGSDSSSVPSSDSEGDDSEEDDEDLHQVAAHKKTASSGGAKTTATTTTPEQHRHNGAPVVVTTNRLFLRNLPFCATEDEIIEACSSCSGAEVVDCHIPIDDAKRNKGYAFVKFLSVEDASSALEKLDGTAFQGRILHVLPAKEDTNNNAGNAGDIDTNGMADNDTNTAMMTTHKKAMELARQQEAGKSTTGWSANYIRGDAVVDNLANRLGLVKGDILNVKDNLSSGDAAVRLALGETHVIEENRTFFRKHGIDMDVLVPSSSQSKVQSSKRSQTTVLVKNLPFNTSQEEITKVFHTIGGDAPTILLPPSRTIALVEYSHANDAKRAFRKLAYKRFKHVPLYLEWAPLLAKTDNNSIAKDKNTLSTETENDKHFSDGGDASSTTSALPNSHEHKENGAILEDESEGRGHSCTLYVKNLNFKTTEEHLRKFFEDAMGHVQAVKIPTKVAPVRKIVGGEEGKVKHLSMGYGFVEMKSEEMARSAVKKLQGKLIDGHTLELKMSTRESNTLNDAGAKPKVNNRQNTKLMVRNVPFQTSRTELLKLFGSFGQLKTIRLPKKFDGGHRGFAFVEFVTGNEALNAMNALSQTHLYGRHLVLEWAEGNSDIETLRTKAKRDAHTVGMEQETNNRSSKKIRSDNFT